MGPALFCSESSGLADSHSRTWTWNIQHTLHEKGRGGRQALGVSAVEGPMAQQAGDRYRRHMALGGLSPFQVSLNCCVMFLIPGFFVLSVSQGRLEGIWLLLN